MINNIFPC